jgi:hypothetical protein
MKGLATALLSRTRAEGGNRPEPPVSLFEFWPSWLFYAPVIAQWIALGLRYGDFSLPTAANPRIVAGGLCGETKSSTLDLVAPADRDWLAPYAVTRTGAEQAPDLAAARQATAAVGLSYPLVAKPDIGCNGTGVRLIDDEAALARYLAEFPRGAPVLLQAYVPYPGEAGLFYIRRPGEARGRISSVTLKSSPVLVGDGRRTLRELIRDDARTGRLPPRLFLKRLAARLDTVPASGEPVRLVFVGNHCKGSTFHNGQEHATEALTARLDAIAQAMPDFHFGRFDLRFRSLSELRQGRGFTIIEINGVGSEATHIWDPRTTLIDAYLSQFMHYRAAFEIGRRMRAAGHRPSGTFAMLRLWRLQKRLMAAYPVND